MDILLDICFDVVRRFEILSRGFCSGIWFNGSIWILLLVVVIVDEKMQLIGRFFVRFTPRTAIRYSL